MYNDSKLQRQYFFWFLSKNLDKSPQSDILRLVAVLAAYRRVVMGRGILSTQTSVLLLYPPGGNRTRILGCFKTF